MLDRVVLLLVVGFVVVTFGPWLVGARMMIDSNLTTLFPPYDAAHGAQIGASTACRTDTIEVFAPGHILAADALRHGRLPSPWLPWEAGGQAFSGVPSFALLSPLSLPWYVLPTWLAPAFVKLAGVLVAVVGMLGLARRHGLSRASGLLGGAVFASTGFMSMWSNWPQVEVAAWIPMLFWALEAVVASGRARHVAAVGAVLAAMLFAGFPAVVVFTLTAAAPYVLYRTWTLHGIATRAAVASMAKAAGGVALGVALAAIQLVPFASELSLFTAGRSENGQQHLPLGLLVSTVAPAAFGTCGAGEPVGRNNQIEANGFLGAAAMVLVLVALLMLSRRGTPGAGLQRFALVALALTALAIWVGPPVLTLLQSLPFYSTNSVVRAQSVAGFLGAALCAVGFERLQRGPEDTLLARLPRRGRLVVVGVALGLVVVLCVLVARSAIGYADTDFLRSQLPSASWRPALLLVLAGVLVVVAVRTTSTTRVLVLTAVAVLALAQSAFFLRDVLPQGDRDNLYPSSPAQRYLDRHLGDERYASFQADLFPATAEMYRLRAVTGHQFMTREWVDLLKAVDPTVMLTRTYATLATPTQDAGRSHILDRMAARYWVARPGLVAGRFDRVQDPLTRTYRLGDGDEQSCTVRGGPLRAVGVVLGAQTRVRSAKVVLQVTVRSGDRTVVGRARVPTRLSARTFPVSVLGEDLPAGGTATVSVTVTGAQRPLLLRGDAGGPQCVGVRPEDDGLRVVETSAGATVWARSGAMPRVRWAERSEVVPRRADRVRMLAAGVPTDTVLLDDDSQPAASGRPATVTKTADAETRIAARVDAQGGGYLVIADAIVRPGWSATVDGRPVPIVHGDHALAAVHVPAGRHDVRVSYSVPGLRAGALGTAGGLLVLLGLLAGPLLRRRSAPR